MSHDLYQTQQKADKPLVTQVSNGFFSQSPCCFSRRQQLVTCLELLRIATGPPCRRGSPLARRGHQLISPALHPASLSNPLQAAVGSASPLSSALLLSLAALPRGGAECSAGGWCCCLLISVTQCKLCNCFIGGQCCLLKAAGASNLYHSSFLIVLVLF